MSKATTGMLHHVELWVPDLPRAVAGWSWLLGELGYVPFQDWSDGRSWRLGSTYLVFEQSPALSADKHDRCRPGLNHLAFHVENRAMVDTLAERAPRHGWTLLFPERHPHAGGEHHYAAYLEDADGFEVELIAPETPDESHRSE
ncbi:Catechol 2,3-dioxygenase [Streptosporangium subroseum]|uniref:Catechol 2,3-dioxygenase n=1 Tax=Streptosporangium subroseum TaxID=106412 RepID=A0A239KW36_9ACTN|nr:VOC family protein [Streptosporangium subroseum]SNT21823.1 Catechol 2,3-dioxygenase [Streptosporangium subroseum]